MKKIIFIAITMVCLVFFSAFSLLRQKALSSREKNIVVCSPVRDDNQPVGFVYPFTIEADSLEEIAINDNRRPAGEFKNGTLYLELETRLGAWYLESREGKAIPVYAFAEAGKPLQLPGPLIRVPQGSMIEVKFNHAFTGSDLVLHGFCSHPGQENDSIIIRSGESCTLKFNAGQAGTYMYWASAGGLKEPYYQLPFFKDSQLFGAFIVDQPNEKPDPAERILMISIWNDTLNGSIGYQREGLAMNGQSWSFTERLNYEKDKPVHFRVINASNQEHPMHLHGFYFKVTSLGNCCRDSLYSENNHYLAVTELLKPHQTLTFTWIPDREGNWLFHCHTLFHIMPGSFLRSLPEMTEARMNDVNTHAREGMAGLIMGITVQNPIGVQTGFPQIPKNKERELTLIVQEKKNYYDTMTGMGFILKEGNFSSGPEASIPGPPIILERGKPVSIKIVNLLKESTTIHWHGLEIESYFDGVAGWGNRGKELAPIVLPGDSFSVFMTPPRAGTFIYHTHTHNFQLFQGMYGAFIVTEPSEIYNPEINKIFLISEGSEFPLIAFLNGKTKPDTLTLSRGIFYRFRIINITPISPDLTASLLFKGQPVNWRILAKDGAELISRQQIMQPATNYPVSIGQTVDFEFNTYQPGNYLFKIKDYLDSTLLHQTLVVY